ncbi:MAG: methyltransferase [Chloroflexi bacterium RBG_13_54_8]|nr:MAG: methyltransferase [Chloroflexi bacterium RBG_13_54_8]
MNELDNISKAVVEGDTKGTEKAVKVALDRGLPATRILQQGLIPAMGLVGQRMKSGEYFLPEVLLSSKAFTAASAVLEPLLAKSQRASSAVKVVLGTVKGDLHDIGKNLVAIMLRGAGFEVVDLGIDVPSPRFLEVVQQTRAPVLGLSALLTTTMVNMKEVVACLSESDWRRRVKVIIGGAPVTTRFAEEIGADGYSPDAAGAVDLVRRLMA